MFINCRHCNALVATHPVTDAPPERCPHCAGRLVVATPPSGAPDAAATPPPGPAAPTATAGGTRDPDAAWRRAADLLSAPAPAATPAPPAQEAAATASPVIPTILPLQHAVGTSGPQAEVGEQVHTSVPLPGDTATSADTPQGAPVPAPAAAPSAEPSPEPAGVAGPDAAARSADAPPAAPLQRAAQHPSFVAARAAVARHAARHRWWLPATIAALSLLLLLQVLLADRARLAMDAGWRPWLSSLCGVVGCALPPWREPGAFSLLARDVRPDPARPGVLRASATFRNDARWAQAWPHVVLTLSDVDGRAIGRRAFAPHEYLGVTPTQDTLAPEQSAMIRLDIIEPAANVVAFSFHFE